MYCSATHIFIQTVNDHFAAHILPETHRDPVILELLIQQNPRPLLKGGILSVVVSSCLVPQSMFWFWKCFNVKYFNFSVVFCWKMISPCALNLWLWPPLYKTDACFLFLPFTLLMQCGYRLLIPNNCMCTDNTITHIHLFP